MGRAELFYNPIEDGIPAHLSASSETGFPGVSHPGRSESARGGNPHPIVDPPEITRREGESERDYNDRRLRVGVSIGYGLYDKMRKLAEENSDTQA